MDTDLYHELYSYDGDGFQFDATDDSVDSVDSGDVNEDALSEGM